MTGPASRRTTLTFRVTDIRTRRTTGEAGLLAASFLPLVTKDHRCSTLTRSSASVVDSPSRTGLLASNPVLILLCVDYVRHHLRRSLDGRCRHRFGADP